MWLLRRTSNVLEKINLLPSSTTIISLEGENSASFVTEISIEKYDSVVFKDVMGKWQEYIVRSVEDNGLTKKVYAEHAIFELHDQYIKDMRPTEGTTALTQLTSILSNTRWSVGLVNVGGAPGNFFYYISVYDAMKTLADKVGGELSYEIKIQNNQITQRKVNLVDRLGGDYGYIFTYDNNLLGITKTVLDDDIYTALIGRGQGEQISENGWGRRLTLEDIDQPDSPLGSNYVEDVAARDLYGLRSTSNPSTKIHRVATVEFDDVTDVEELYLLTKEMLQRINQPKFNYQVNIMLLDNMVVALGDDIRVVDLEFGGNRLALYGRVTSIQYDLLYPENTQVTIGNIKNDMSGFQKEIENQVAFFRSKSNIWDRANAFDETNHLSASYIRDLLDEWNAKANASGGFTYAIEGQGSITYDRAIDDNPTQALQIVGGTMRIANSKDPQGNWIWRTAITADGVSGEEILANSITTNHLRSDVGSNLDISSNETIQLQSQTIQSLSDEVYTEINSRLSLQNDQMQLIFDGIVNDINLTNEQLTLFRTYFRWDSNGAIIGKEGSPIELYQTNDRIEFREGGTPFAYWEGGTMSVDRLIASISIIIGEHIVEKYQSPAVGKTTLVKMVT